MIIFRWLNRRVNKVLRLDDNQLFSFLPAPWPASLGPLINITHRFFFVLFSSLPTRHGMVSEVSPAKGRGGGDVAEMSPHGAWYGWECLNGAYFPPWMEIIHRIWRRYRNSSQNRVRIDWVKRIQKCMIKLKKIYLKKWGRRRPNTSMFVLICPTIFEI